MAAKVLGGSYASYPNPPGDKQWNIKQIAGPSSYTQISTGTPPTGGISVKASDLGLTNIEAVIGVPTSDNGQYHLIPFGAASIVAPQTTILFEAIVTATGAQVAGAVDLSARTFNIFVLGN